MRNVFPVPEKLRSRITAVDDNRQPGDEIRIDARLFVTIFRDDIERWLKEHREQVARESTAK